VTRSVSRRVGNVVQDRCPRREGGAAYVSAGAVPCDRHGDDEGGDQRRGVAM